MPNTLKQKLKNREVSYGIWLEWMDPDLIEFVGYLGFDYVMLDAEHGPRDRAMSGELFRACDAVGITPIVRVPANDAALILGYLELGAKGIYVPHVRDRAGAEAVVNAVKYAPLGQRSAGSARAVRYGLTDTPVEYFRRANDETMTIALIEDMEGIRNLDGILGVEGLDVVGIGDGDLSHTVGHVGERGHPDVRAIVEPAEARIAASAKALDAVVSSADEARMAVDRGCTMVSLAVRGLLGRELRGFLADLPRDQPASASAATRSS